MSKQEQEVRMVYTDDILRYKNELDRLMGEDGPFARKVNGYTVRPIQVEMAKSVTEAITDCQTLLAEAGTGTGKTYAYLIPALLWGGKVIISTGTKNLQDQLYFKDIQTVRKVLNASVTTALLKGRSNYLCRYRLEETLKQAERLLQARDVAFLKEIVRFNQITESGDRSDLPSVPEKAFVWNYVTSTKENCLGVECPYFKECFVTKARQEAMEADVVVVNHHLFFADIALKDNGVAELLPTANTVIFDEAHQLPDIATTFFGRFISTQQLQGLCRDVQVEGLSHARDSTDWISVVSAVDKTVKELRLALPEKAERMAIHQIPEMTAFIKGLDDLMDALENMRQTLENQAERSKLLQKYFERVVEVKYFMQHWLSLAKGESKTEDVPWVETLGQTFLLHLTPLSISDVFSKQLDAIRCSWIFTSATLAVKQDFSYFSSRMGLEKAKMQTWPSPFPYSDNALLYVPKKMPMPQSPKYSDAVVNAALPLIESCDGGVFILCTTLRAVNQIAERLNQWLVEKQLDIPLFVQGTTNRHELLERFRQAGNGILIGSQSFWEGVDVKGRALSLVIVDKLPFAPPDDPVLAARLEVLKRNGGNGFKDYQIPEAIISLKQGVGRLIRDDKDTGVLMICDIRLVDKSYGSKIWRSLPPFTRTRDETRACEFLKERISTS